MAWDENIPLATDKIKDSQPSLLGNFQQLNTFINVNHVGFSSPDEGKHKFLQMPNQSSAPNTNSTENALFVRASQNPVGAGLSTMCLKQSNNSSISEFTTLTNDWVRLPSGLLFKWADVTIAASTNDNQAVHRLSWGTSSTIAAFTEPPFAMYLTQFNIGGVSDIGATVSTVKSNLTATDFTVNVVTTNTLGGWNSFNLQIVAIGIG